MTSVGLAAGALYVMLFPGRLQQALSQLVNEMSPLMGSVLAILIVLGGLRIIVFGRRK